MAGFSAIRGKERFGLVAPRTIGDTGIGRSLLEQLALKILGLRGEMSLIDLAGAICLRLAVVEDTACQNYFLHPQESTARLPHGGLPDSR